ncbi:MAG: helicase [Bacteroidetes bacterium]|nr:MAG: helicase [Bacteroidota bacterium]
MTLNAILTKYRKEALNERNKGDKFEKLMQSYLKTDPLYANKFKDVWMWNEFPAKNDLGSIDTGIDLVGLTHEGDYWAVQCKFFGQDAEIHKPDVDSFLATSSRRFRNEQQEEVGFAHRLWIATTNHWGKNAEEAIQQQNPPVSKISLHNLKEAPISWEKLDKGIVGDQAIISKKTIRPHQQNALENTHKHFQTENRGKLIMACGTGKTFTSLRIAEHETNNKGLILFLVPSIALLGQSLREWTAEAIEPIQAICICSDAQVSAKKSKNEDSTDGFTITDLALPASTDVEKIIKQFESIRKKTKKGMTVVFSTYQSIQVIANAQEKLLNKRYEDGFGIFDLVICDEAHRTTGITLAGEDSSHFVKIHDNNFIKAKKRIYMTATPKIYLENAKNKADKYEALLCSMDDEKLYGTQIYRIGFGEAVEQGLLTDYKVLILALNEEQISKAIQDMVTDKDNEINIDDASMLSGCIKALSKQVIDNSLKDSDPEPMHRAVAFCSKIVDSKKITNAFNNLKGSYYQKLSPEEQEKTVIVSSDHVDGTMSSNTREEKLSWLKEDTANKNECRILTNARCLSEGVDVPALDAVIFMSARDSQVDVVQSVGRVMRKAPNKKYGYIIIPVLFPSNTVAHQAMDDNKKYKVVWTVLNALRAHDERFDAEINKIELNRKKPDNIIVTTVKTESEEGTTASSEVQKAIDAQMALQFKELQGAIYAKIVEKVGTKEYWEKWAKDVARIAEQYITRIRKLINSQESHRKDFADFLAGLQNNINPAVSETEAIEMLAQHLITKPIFDALFKGYSFVKNNPVSIAMQKMVDILEEHSLEKETEVLTKFYESVKRKVADIDNAEGKQKIIVELYDKFFKTAFPKMVEKLGIVYTPIEVVDFIIHSVEAVLNKEFDRSISDENIHILDPFTGTGTFMTRLLQSKLIKKQDLQRKYTQELHANEIVLLAYYIAAINIENAFFDLQEPKNDYMPFSGMVLTDTFQLGESEASQQAFLDMFPQNSERVEAQRKAPLRVIIGNPPYSVGQKSANDNAQNQEYKALNRRIAETYAQNSQATSLKALYDSYIKAFRWASDRLEKEHGGIIAFITNAGWLESNGMDSFRKCLEKEFSSIYVFNLRGAIRGLSGINAKKEGQNVFDIMTGVAIIFLVKNPNLEIQKADIQYFDIGNYLNKKQKLETIQKLHSVQNISWQKLEPNEQGDWIAQRNEGFMDLLPLASEKKYDTKSKSFFLTYSLGLATGRDAWVYNSSKMELEKNMQKTILFFNQQSNNFEKAKKEKPALKIDDFIDTDPTKISWNRNFKDDLEKYKIFSYQKEALVTGFYRPFCKQHLYFDKDLNAMLYQNKKLFPKSNLENKVICVSCVGSSKGLSVIMSNSIVDLHFNGDTQCFPLYYYEEIIREQRTLYTQSEKEFVRRDGISNFILEQARSLYGNLQKEDIFYYVYGFLHSPSYREMYANDLKKMLPRLPLVDSSSDFWAFSKAGRALADLHLNYEKMPSALGVDVVFINENTANYEVQKMRFGKNGKEIDKSTIEYNSQIMLKNIPLETYQYVVNGKSAVEWLMERYQITTHKESLIKNDPNDWSAELGNEKYILNLLLSVIHVSLETLKIVKNLPVT